MNDAVLIQPHEPLIAHVRDMAAMARELLNAHMVSGKKSELVGACLCINHIVEWEQAARRADGRTDCGDNEFKRAFGDAFPNWRAIRDIATWLKHPASPAPRTARDIVEWEDDDWFDVASERPEWFVIHHGKRRAIAALCRLFLDECERTLSAAPQPDN